VSEPHATREWLNSRAAAWRKAAQLVPALRNSRRATLQEALGAVESYSALARDLATARQLAPRSRTTAGLESLYAQLHALISRKPPFNRASLVSLLREHLPSAVHALRGRIAAIAGLMAASAVAGWCLIEAYPELIGLFASNSMIEQVEQGHLWTEGIINIMPSSVLSVSILANNIVVSVFAFCSGILFGLGTFYLIALNGLLLGSTFAFVHQHGLAAALFKFIVAHGPVELSVICLAGAAGTAIGESLIRPEHGSRRDSFQACTTRVAPVLLAGAALLVGCGFIEGFISPDPRFGLPLRIAIGAAYWLLMFLLLTGRLFRRPAAATHEAHGATGS
jgi:uncharacterized membrane protein SpoIIM required for sporulation